MTGVGIATQHSRSHFDRERFVIQNGRHSSNGHESTVAANVSFFEKLNGNKSSAIEKRILHFNSSGLNEITKKTKKEKDEKPKIVVNGDCTYDKQYKDILLENGDNLNNLTSEHVKVENGIHEIDFEEEKEDQVIKVENVLERHGSIKIRIGKPKICNGDNAKELSGLEKGLSSPPNISSIFLSKSNSDLISPSPSPYQQVNKTNGNHSCNDIVAKAISKLEADIKAKNTKKKLSPSNLDMMDRLPVNTVVTLNNNNGSFRIKETVQNGDQKDNETKTIAKVGTKKTKTFPVKNSKTKMTVNGKPASTATNGKTGMTVTPSPTVNGTTGSMQTSPKGKAKSKASTPSKSTSNNPEVKPTVTKTTPSKAKQEPANQSKALKRPPILLKQSNDKTGKETKTKDGSKAVVEKNKTNQEKNKDLANKSTNDKNKKTDTKTTSPVQSKFTTKTDKTLSSSTGSKSSGEKKSFAAMNGSKAKVESTKQTEKKEGVKVAKSTNLNGVDKKSPAQSALKAKPSLNGKTNGLKTASKTEKVTNKTKTQNITKNDKIKISAPKPTREKSLLSFERKKDEPLKKVVLENNLNKSVDIEVAPIIEPEPIPSEPEIISEENTSIFVETTVDVKDIVKKLENGEIHDDVEIKEEEKAKEEEKESDLLVCKQNRNLETILTSENEKTVTSIVSDIITNDVDIISNDVINDDIISNDVISEDDDVIEEKSIDIASDNNNGVLSFVEKIKNEYNKKNLDGDDYKYVSRISPVPPPAPKDLSIDEDEEEKSNPYARNVPSKEFLEFLEDYKINEGSTIVERNETVYETGKYISPSLIRPITSSLMKNSESANTTYSHKIKMADLKKKKDADNKYEQSKEDILSTDLRENGIEYNDDSNISDLISGLKSEDHAKTDFSSWYDKTYGHYAS